MGPIDVLLEDLQMACVDSLDGLPPGDLLYRRLRRVVEARLRTKMGHGAFRDVHGFNVNVGPSACGEGIEIGLSLRRVRTVQDVKVRVL